MKKGVFMKKFFVMIAVLFFVFSSAPSEEGMWMLSQLDQLDLKANGLRIGISDIYDPGKPGISDAVVLLGGGTAELVSPNGLMLTNHHVAFGAVQRASTGGTDYITGGFLAKQLSDEIEAPGYSAHIMQRMEDITPEFKKFLKIKDPLKREKAIDRRIMEITEGIEKGKTDVKAVVAGMYSGRQYILYVYKRFDDVRVVYVPPASIGNYGGDIDNWMWPRHTGDFSFMRVYMAPDGTGRKYHKDNVPYKPEYWLKLAREGLKVGDQTFIVGYPGGTVRYRTSYSAEWNLEYLFPERIKYFGEVIGLLESFWKDSQVAKAKVAGMHKGLNNSMKYYQGVVEGMTKTGFVEQKRNFEKDFTAHIGSKKKLAKKYGRILPSIGAEHKKFAETKKRDFAMGYPLRLSGTVFGMAQNAYFTVREREKPEKERDPLFSEKDIERMVSRLSYSYMSFYEPADQALFLKSLKYIDSMKGAERIAGFEYILGGSDQTPEQWADNAYRATKLKDAEFVKSLFTKTSGELEALNDPFIDLAKRIYAEREEYKKRSERSGAVMSELRKDYISALFDWKGSRLYPDANGTIRFSYGRVKGYSPRDAVVHRPFTFIRGMLEKDTGIEPFDMPAKVKDLYAAKDFGRWAFPGKEDVPIAFLHCVDSTGGNSGSPVLNADGELAGILFDGNYESMTGDWQYDPDIQRSISVDIRFVMFITEKLGKADNILKELGLQ